MKHLKFALFFSIILFSCDSETELEPEICEIFGEVILLPEERPVEDVEIQLVNVICSGTTIVLSCGAREVNNIGTTKTDESGQFNISLETCDFLKRLEFDKVTSKKFSKFGVTTSVKPNQQVVVYGYNEQEVSIRFTPEIQAEDFVNLHITNKKVEFSEFLIMVKNRNKNLLVPKGLDLIVSYRVKGVKMNDVIIDGKTLEMTKEIVIPL